MELFPLLQGQSQSALTGVLGTENKRASRSSCHATASFLNAKNSADRKTHLGSVVIQDCSEEKDSFPCKRRAATCSTAAAHLHAMSQSTGTMKSLKNIAGWIQQKQSSRGYSVRDTSNAEPSSFLHQAVAVASPSGMRKAETLLRRNASAKQASYCTQKLKLLP